jgi:hypothetical protein
MAELQNAAAELADMFDQYRGELVVGGSGVHRLMRRVRKARGGRLPDWVQEQFDRLRAVSGYDAKQAVVISRRLRS